MMRAALFVLLFCLLPFYFCPLLTPSLTVGLLPVCTPPLEVEPDGRLDASVAGGRVAAAEAARGRERLAEEGRAEVADGVGEVRVVEHVDEEEREGHRVALLLARGAAECDHH